MRGRVPELPLRVLWPPWIVSSSLEQLRYSCLGVDHQAVGQHGHGSELGFAIWPSGKISFASSTARPATSAHGGHNIVSDVLRVRRGG